ncbi:MAG TPA: elongation factor 4 [candidate division Zixibacteria bacterium]|nr:elongation factor 4 [candidate division Zixibacteria bacterium]
MKDRKYIRNFSIIAHIDHGKSTLADRLLELTGSVPEGRMVEQILDDMELERERGITIKAHAVKMDYRYRDGQIYELNLIDTPGHVDFSYEVSRSLASCEGAILVVDASQGIEAQTISNIYLALENDLEIIPVINKIDLPSARPDDVAEHICELLGGNPEDIIRVSARTGENVEKVLEAIVEKIPPPEGDPKKPLRALVFDSYYDKYRGVVLYVRIFDGELRVGDKILLMASGKEYEVDEIGYLRLELEKTDVLSAGEVGYIMANIKDVRDARVGDTVTLADNPAPEPLPGYREAKPMVFSGLYPTDPSSGFEDLRAALEKLRLNDASLTFEPESSAALGFGFRCGFLGMLHMEITQERLEREFGLDLVATVPNVRYKVVTNKGEELWIERPSDLPEPTHIDHIEEPYVRAEIITPHEYIGAIMELVKNRRGEYIATEYVDPHRVMLKFDIPLAEIIFDFFDKLKTVSRGYATLDYEFLEYRPSDLIKLDILVNGEMVDALSMIVHRDEAYFWGQKMVSKLKELIPRQLFEVIIQAAIGKRVISRARVAPLRKDVTAKCYGGDITRKRKLLEKQKEGKKRMKMVGSVEIPQEAFFAVLKIER